jgi:hypothetical protein
MSCRQKHWVCAVTLESSGLYDKNPQHMNDLLWRVMLSCHVMTPRSQ